MAGASRKLEANETGSVDEEGNEDGELSVRDEVLVGCRERKYGLRRLETNGSEIDGGVWRRNVVEGPQKTQE